MLVAPTIAAWLRTNPRGAPLIWASLGFLPFVIGPWHLLVAPYATPQWSGYVKGWEVSLLDSVAIGVLVGTRGRWPRITLLVPFLAYLFAVMLAIHQAQFGAFAVSYMIQLFRVFLVFLAVARVVANERGERGVLIGLVAGLAVQAGYAIWARAGGALQTGGSLGHQNLLGFVSHMVLMPAFALLLAGRWQKIALTGVLAGIIAVILTVSRATIAFSAAGLALTLLLSIILNFTGRKALTGALAVFLLACSYPLVQSELHRRFELQGSTFFAEDKERGSFEQAAHAMLTANPTGVGPNHYVFIANTQGYSSRAGVAWRTESRSTNVHNSYLLVAVETGYFGLLTMLALLGSTMWYAFSTAVRFRNQPSAQILIGLGCGILAVSLHSFFEWVFVLYPTQYLFAVSLGLISGIRSRLDRNLALTSSVKRSSNRRYKRRGVAVESIDADVGTELETYDAFPSRIKHVTQTEI